MPNPAFREVDKMIGALTKNKKAVTLSFIFLFTAFGIQSSHADYYPSGIQQNVSEQTLIDNGWTLFYQETYAVPISALASEIKPSGQYVILTGKAVGSSSLPVLAAAPTAQVFTETEINTPKLLNGTYWYNTPSQSIGFAPTNTIQQMQADAYESTYLGDTESSPLRLSWHLYGDGGWRLGDVLMLNNSIAYLKQVWTWNGPAAPPPPPPPPPVPVETNVRKSSNLQFYEAMYGSDKLSDPDGQLRKTVDSINAKYGNLIK
jgi:hypothetical protein